MTSAPTADAGLAIQGRVYGGQQPIVGARMYLFAANTTGYGGLGIAPSSLNASVSLLTSGTGRTLDTSGGATNGDYYVTTGTGGAFSITGDYSCTANTQVYLYVLGGDAGSGANAAAGLLAALGNCPSGGSFATQIPNLIVNEATTVAAAYAFAGFATDATHVSSSGTAAALVGIQNAFANAANLVNIVGGSALATTPAGNGTVPQAEINTLANVLAACVNTNGAISGPATPTACYTLLNDAQSAGTTGTVPSETATAAINMAHYPMTNVAGLYALSTATPPFAPALSAQPNDFSVSLLFTSPDLNAVRSLAIDASGNVWGANSGGNSLTELSPAGAVLSGTTGFTSLATYRPEGIAIDASGNVWFASRSHSPYSTNLQEFSPTGAVLSGANGYTGGGLDVMDTPSGVGFPPRGIVIDLSGDIWIGASESVLAEFSHGGTALSPTGGITGGGLKNISGGPAVDSAGNIWTAGFSAGGSPCDGALAKFTSAGVAISTSAGYTGGGISCPPEDEAVAIGPGNSIYVADSDTTDVMAVFNSSGTATSGSGYLFPGVVDPNWQVMDGASMIWSGNANMNALSTAGVARFVSPGLAISGSYSAEVDESGNLWIGEISQYQEVVGIAAPVVTPIVTAAATNKLGQLP